jgi:hypothetical protein
MREESHTKLRTLLADLERHLPGLDDADSTQRAAAVVGTRDTFAELERTLDLGPEPLTRQCPNCRGTIARAATRCMHCWHKSEPPPH